MSLTAFPIQTSADVELLRQIRNTCAAGFSNHTAQISQTEQARWWNGNRGQVLAWLYQTLSPFDELVGFGLLRRDGSDWLTVVGVLPWFEGRGYGKAITADIVRKSPGRCRATARKDNPGAVKLHVAEDWAIVDGPDERLVYFVGRRNPELEEAQEHWAEHGMMVT